jgi:transposase
VKDICAYVKEKHGITYSRSGMTDWLKEHGFVYKKPKKVPGKLNPQQQEGFIEAYQELKKDLKPNEEIYL